MRPAAVGCAKRAGGSNGPRPRGRYPGRPGVSEHRSDTRPNAGCRSLAPPVRLPKLPLWNGTSSVASRGGRPAPDGCSRSDAGVSQRLDRRLVASASWRRGTTSSAAPGTCSSSRARARGGPMISFWQASGSDKRRSETSLPECCRAALFASRISPRRPGSPAWVVKCGSSRLPCREAVGGRACRPAGIGQAGGAMPSVAGRPGGSVCRCTALSRAANRVGLDASVRVFDSVVPRVRLRSAKPRLMGGAPFRRQVDRSGVGRSSGERVGGCERSGS
jgi:hypothetical protein